jgi:hypothetical protein
MWRQLLLEFSTAQEATCTGECALLSASERIFKARQAFPYRACDAFMDIVRKILGHASVGLLGSARRLRKHIVDHCLYPGFAEARLTRCSAKW